MANIIDLTTGDNGAIAVVVNGQPRRTILNPENLIVKSTSDGAIIKLADENWRQTFSLEDTISLDGEEIAPTDSDELVEALSNFFPEATGDGGGSGIVDIEGDVYNMAAYNKGKWTPTADNANLTISNEPAGDYTIIVFVINDGFTGVQILNNSVPLNADGNTIVAIVKLNGEYSFISDAVAGVPEITTQPTNQTVSEGDLLSLSVDYTANPAANVQWEISVNAGVSYSDIAGATTKIYTTTATSEDAGLYRAKVTNTEGSVYSNVVTVVVNTVSSEVPLILSDSSNITQSINGDSLKQWNPTTDGDVTPAIGLFAGKIALGTDGYFGCDFNGFTMPLKTQACWLGLSTTNELKEIAAMFVWTYPNDSPVWYTNEDTYTGYPYAKLRLRVTGPVITIEGQDAGSGIWSTLYTFTTPRTTDLWFVFQIKNGTEGILTNAVGYNVQ